MRHIKWIVAVLVVVIAIPFTAASQTLCGNADGQYIRDIRDYAFFMDHLLGISSVTLAPEADCDNRLGVTIGDAELFIQYVFQVFDTTIFDCSIQSVYGFEPSLTDTIFLPYMTGIPDEITSVNLPIITSFADDVRAFYLPTTSGEANGPGLFALNAVIRQGANPGEVDGHKVGVDSANFVGIEFDADDDVLSGRQNFYNLSFTRTSPGEASINCAPAFRSAVLRMCVKKGNELYVPVLQYYEVPVPTPVVTVSPSTLNITATAGLWSVDSYSVTFTSDIQPVSFTLATSDSWIVIEDFSPTGYTTSATITVRANASATPSGSYAGQITFGDISPTDATFEPAAIDVALTVLDPVIYPPGDLNCDGLVTIGDIVLLIDCLFIDTRPVPACE